MFWAISPEGILIIDDFKFELMNRRLSLSNIEQIRAVRDFEIIYGPWSITRITQTK